MTSAVTDKLEAWVAELAPRPVAVLAATRDALAAARGNPDRVDANLLADIVLRDPLMTLKVLALVAQKLGQRLATPVETVTGGLVLLGIEPFFREFDALPTVQERLAPQPDALAGLGLGVQRAHRAARLAAAFAVHRMDQDAEVLHQAALLHDFSGLLLWCEAPGAMLEIARRQRADAQLRSHDAQRHVLGTTCEALDDALMTAWNLPPVLREMTQLGQSAQPGPQCVQLAVRIARHSQSGWDNPALPDDFIALGHLLNLPAVGAESLVMQVEA